MRRALAVCLAAVSIVSSAAAQPAPRQAQVAPNVATAQFAGQNANIAGSWDVLPLPPGRLSLTPGANGVLNGTFDVNGEAASCLGQWRGSQFVIQCRMSSAAVIFSAKAVQDPPLATQRRAIGGTTALGTNRRLVGNQYFCGFGLSGQEAPNCLEVALTGTPAS